MFLESVAKVLDLPRDVVFDLPRLVLWGDRELLVENHKGLLAFDSCRVVVGSSCGALEIKGERLCLKRILVYELVVVGNIERISYLKTGGEGC